MKEGLTLRIALTVVITLTALFYVLPSVTGGEDSPLAPVLPEAKVNLGLDLMGGIHLTLGVEVDKAVDNALSMMGRDLRTEAREEGLTILKPAVGADRSLSFTLMQGDKAAELDAMLNERYTDLNVDAKEDAGDGRLRYTLSMSREMRDYYAGLALDQAIKTIRNRIDEFGVSEPDIRRQQGYRIQVQLPGLKDPERAIELIGKTAHLEFKLVDEETDPAKAEQGILPPGTEVRVMLDRNMDGSYTERSIVVTKDALMTGEYITNANVNFDSYNTPYVSLTFNARGARLFERITGENVQRRLAIVLDGKVYSAPTIQQRIAGGRASITGRFSVEEARDLAIVLRAGALPAPVTILEERSVGPTLGQESIDKGFMAAAIGGVLVLIFMVVYYGFAGLVADVVLALNIVLIMAGLAAFGATLTLPGIAGIILTIGMAVDANVLIFERIREELRRGLSVRAAIQEGYSRATLTILDANVTTIIAAVILYQFGTGPIRGFAVTLSLGILASMFTAIFVSRIFFDAWTAKEGPVKLSI